MSLQDRNYFISRIYLLKLVRYCNAQYDHNSRCMETIYNICDEIIISSSSIDKYVTNRNYVVRKKAVKSFNYDFLSIGQT